MNSGGIGGIVLAAGRSRRFGGDKREALLASGHTMLERTLELMCECADETLLVIGEADSQSRFSARFPQVRVLRSPRSVGGMGYALADAVAQSLHWDACLVSLADKPFVAPASMARVRDSLQAHSLVVPTFEGAWGHPVGFARQHFLALTRLEGDTGARTYIESERSRCLFLELGDPGLLADVDTPEQLESLSRALGQR